MFGIGRSPPTKRAANGWRACCRLMSNGAPTGSNVVGDGAFFTVARGQMRRILADCVGLGPRDLIFEYNAYGKPSLANPANGPHFSLSHSAQTAALAVCWHFPVGIDIELVKPIDGGIAERFFSKAENLELSTLPDCERVSAFFRCWVRKEAVAKALGFGLSRDPR